MIDLTEHQIQRLIIDWADLVLPPAYRLVHVPNEGKRSRIAGHRLKQAGMRPGFPDLILLGPVVGLIEVKAWRKYPNEDQREWRDWALSTGLNWGLARSIDDVRDLFRQWSIPTREAAQEAGIPTEG